MPAPVPDERRIRELLLPYADESLLKPALLARIATYTGLLLHWNARMNLTAVRNPEDLVQRQVGESLFVARFVPATGTLLDFGSGAGFPGIPLQLVHPGLQVTLAESQGKKAGFLREATRVLGTGSRVWAGRVEDLPTSERFDVVTMRAVDHTEAMLTVAADRVGAGGRLLRFIGTDEIAEQTGWSSLETSAVPQSSGRLVLLTR